MSDLPPPFKPLVEAENFPPFLDTYPEFHDLPDKIKATDVWPVYAHVAHLTEENRLLRLRVQHERGWRGVLSLRLQEISRLAPRVRRQEVVSQIGRLLSELSIVDRQTGA